MKRALLFLVGLAACNGSSTKAGVTSEPVVADAQSVSSAKANGGSAAAGGGSRLKTEVASSDSELPSLVRTKRLEAKADNHVLVLLVSATWCDPCKKLKSEIAAGHLDDRLAKVSFLEFDADKDGDRLRAAGYTFNFVPFVALPGPDGHPADTQQATGHGSDAWKELLGKLDAWQR